jgi:hypothetical protein
MGAFLLPEDQLNKAFALFDAYNQADPELLRVDEQSVPAEYYYAQQLYLWVKKLNPEASDAVLLASRAQHIGRWEIPRNTYEAGKVGYLKWRKDLSKFHADKAGELLLKAGYENAVIERVQHIIQKKNLRNDPEVQLIENALCLVFLEFQYENFLLKHDDKKLIGIIQKTWAKMTDPGRAAALELTYSERGKALILTALGI